MNIVELGELLKEKSLSAKITYRDGFFRAKLKSKSGDTVSYYSNSIIKAFEQALSKAERIKDGS